MKHFLHIVILRIGLRITHYHINIILGSYHRSFRSYLCLMTLIIGLRPPVSHDNTLKSPLFSQNGCTQIIAICSPEPIYTSISSHYRTCTTLFYRNLKTFQINLTQSSLRDHRVRSTSSNLLIITTEMLYRTSDSRLRHSLHLSCTNPACKNRILRNILKITSVQRISVNIHTRSKKRINLIQAEFLTRHLIQCTHKLHIKSTAKRSSIRQRKRLRTTIHTNTGRTIRTTSNRNSKRSQAICHSAKSSRRSRSNLRATHTLTPEHRDQILLTNLRNKLLHGNLLIQHIHQLISLIPCIIQCFWHLIRPALLRINSTNRHLLSHRLISPIRQ